MAKLIVTRPRLGRPLDAWPSFNLLFDGQAAGAIGAGETIEIDLPPGPHEFRLKCCQTESEPVVVEAEPNQTHRLAVGLRMLDKRFGQSMLLAFLPMFGLFTWIMFDVFSLVMHGPRGGPAVVHFDLQTALIIPAASLPFFPVLFLALDSSNDLLVACHVPSADLTERQIAQLLPTHAFRVRITIRRMMIAIALMALSFWGSLELSRFTRASSFRFQASLHADQEARFRKFEQRSINLGLEMEKKGFGRGRFTKEAARHAAVADYHAAMKRKYDDAIARGAFTVEPDPPEPPWP